MSLIESPAKVEAAKGKLGVLMPGLGAVSTTFIAGTLAIRKGISRARSPDTHQRRAGD